MAESDAQPYYIVLFQAGEGLHTPYSAVRAYRQYPWDEVTWPLGFDRTLVGSVPSLWYCLHLPRTRLDYRSLPAATAKRIQALELAHRIFLIPTSVEVPRLRQMPPSWPATIVAPPHLGSQAADLAKSLERQTILIDSSRFDGDSLREHWVQIGRALNVDVRQPGWPHRVLTSEPNRTLAIAGLPLARQLASHEDDGTQYAAGGLSTSRVMRSLLNDQVRLSAFAELQRQDPPESEARNVVRSLMKSETANFTCPVAIAAPGASTRTFARRARVRFGEQVREDAAIEESVTDTLLAHRTAARSGLAVKVPSVPTDAFCSLFNLEQMFAGRPSGSKVWSQLEKLSKRFVSVLREEDRIALLHASSFTCFSEFPVGLVTIPPDSSPLCCRAPVAYRPLAPLTRALQFELSDPPAIYLRDGLRILCIECIPRSDIVGRLSRVGWSEAKDVLGKTPRIEFQVVEAQSVADVRAAICENRYDILILSAHGVFDRASNRTGLRIGSESIFDALPGPLPPVVCLAACAMAPRGAGSLNLPDLLFREGALAVLAPLVNIDVRRNATLMTRFFLYLQETLEGRNALRGIDEVWNFTQTTNTVMDVAAGCKAASSWILGDRAVLSEFMLDKSVGRLRGPHTHKDTETILQEMADNRGIGDAFRAWIGNQSYVPESLFYAFLGWPERIILHDKHYEELRNREKLLSPA